MKIRIIIFLVLLLPGSAYASEFYFGAPGAQAGLHTQVEVGVFLNTQGKSINAIEGVVLLPSDLKLDSIREGNSIISFWSQKPRQLEDSSVSFQGILPGGYTGTQGYLFSLIVEPQQLGQLTIGFKNAVALISDGLATSDHIILSPLQLNVIKKGAPGFSAPLDITPPETFIPFVAADPAIFNNQWFLVFATQDKESGIDHYEVREGFWGSFVQAESPYLLKQQSRDRKIFVKAVDAAGNERLASAPAQRIAWYQWVGIFSILIVILAALFISRKTWSRLPR